MQCYRISQSWLLFYQSSKPGTDFRMPCITLRFVYVLCFPGNGYIPTSSLREILMALDDQLTPDQLDEMIGEIDTDGSGTVDFEGQ